MGNVKLNRTFNEEETYQAYELDNVFKCTAKDIPSINEKIRGKQSLGRCLIELPDTRGLTHELINSLPDNVDIRVIGGLTEEYAKSFRTPYMDYIREKATYSKDELNLILTKIEDIENNIAPEWNEWEKALYLYEYMKADIVYREPTQAGDEMGNQNRTRTWDTLTGLVSQLSTCAGFSHIYRELCTRNGIECEQVGGNKHKHAWNIVSIGGKNFIVDIIWDAIDFEKGIDHSTHFGSDDIESHKPQCYKEKHENLSFIDNGWVLGTKEKVSEKVPKEKIAKDKLDNFLKSKEKDKQRMLELRGELVKDISPEKGERIL